MPKINDCLKILSFLSVLVVRLVCGETYFTIYDQENEKKQETFLLKDSGQTSGEDCFKESCKFLAGIFMFHIGYNLQEFVKKHGTRSFSISENDFTSYKKICGEECENEIDEIWGRLDCIDCSIIAIEDNDDSDSSKKRSLGVIAFYYTDPNISKLLKAQGVEHHESAADMVRYQLFVNDDSSKFFWVEQKKESGSSSEAKSLSDFGSMPELINPSELEQQ